MAVRQQLPTPLVVEPAERHSHTVVFLHRFPQETTDQELRNKVLSEKRTRDHRTLGEQFPTVHWVFPFCKAQARPWNNLSANDRAAVGMKLGSLPYITQVVLQEAERAGGLDRIILGGQGETAEAAHEAMSSFPEAEASSLDNEDDMAAFLLENFTLASAVLNGLRLAGFVGMHAEGGQMTRDVKDFGMMTKLGSEGIPAKQVINATIIRNTPHKFIHGGYKLQTTTWDGKRIDDFAAFLVSIGVDRLQVTDITRQHPAGQEILTPRERSTPPKHKRAGRKEELSDMQKHALEVARQKKADDAIRQITLHRIEADKVERKLRQERERQNRLLHGGITGVRPTGSTNRLGGGSFSLSMPGSESRLPTHTSEDDKYNDEHD
jgi:hypothetical protein